MVTNEGNTDYFNCQVGVRQGENLSPFLFSIYLNDLEHYLMGQKVNGVKCDTVRCHCKIFKIMSHFICR